MSKASEAKIIEMGDQFVHTVHSVECEKCEAEDEDDFGDSYDAAKTFYKDGWRIVDDVLLCPKCFKNRKK